jgi:hypothetical protein
VRRFARAVDAVADKEIVLAKKTAPLRIEARAVGLDRVGDGELRGGRADRVLGCEGHQDLGAVAGGEVVDINVAERFE